MQILAVIVLKYDKFWLRLAKIKNSTDLLREIKRLHFWSPFTRYKYSTIDKTCQVLYCG
jgi:hypothetical protein